MRQQGQTQNTIKRKNPDSAARAALDSKRVIIIPGFKEKNAHILLKFVPTGPLSLRLQAYWTKKEKNNN